MIIVEATYVFLSTGTSLPDSDTTCTEINISDSFNSIYRDFHTKKFRNYSLQLKI